MVFLYFSRSRPGKNRRRLAFLVVLLVLQAALLVWLWMQRPTVSTRPSTASVPVPPEHTKADYSEASVLRDQCRKIVSVLRDFRRQRGAYPVPAAAAHDEKHDFAIDAAMLAALDGEDAALNPAKVNYLKPWNLSARTLEDLKKGRFHAAFDFEGDSRVPDPSSPGHLVDQDVLVWHCGADGDPATWRDNAFAWLRKP